MAAHLFRRLGVSLLLLFLVLSLTFGLLHLAPGDPILLLGDPRVSPEQRDRIRELYGLDRSLSEQYLRWLGGVALAGEWGVSFSHQRPVTRVLADALPHTAVLGLAALLVQFGVGLLVGAASARRPGSPTDHALRIVSLLLYSLPIFWLGLMALLLFSHLLPLFPPGHLAAVDASRLPPLARLADRLHHLALPALVLGLAFSGAVGRFARNSLLDVLGQDYIRTARAKGVGEARVLWVHGLRNAAPPLVHLLGLSLPFLLSGALVTEVVFSWPGVGRVAYGAVLARDYPLVLGSTVLAATLVIAGSFAADLLHAAVDPRVRRG